MKTKEELYQQIKTMREKMVQNGNENGIHHPSTIQISQKLDKLINEYMKLTQKK